MKNSENNLSMSSVKIASNTTPRKLNPWNKTNDKKIENNNKKLFDTQQSHLNDKEVWPTLHKGVNMTIDNAPKKAIEPIKLNPNNHKKSKFSNHHVEPYSTSITSSHPFSSKSIPATRGRKNKYVKKFDHQNEYTTNGITDPQSHIPNTTEVNNSNTNNPDNLNITSNNNQSNHYTYNSTNSHSSYVPAVTHNQTETRNNVNNMNNNTVNTNIINNDNNDNNYDNNNENTNTYNYEENNFVQSSFLSPDAMSFEPLESQNQTQSQDNYDLQSSQPHQPLHNNTNQPRQQNANRLRKNYRGRRPYQSRGQNRSNYGHNKYSNNDYNNNNYYNNINNTTENNEQIDYTNSNNNTNNNENITTNYAIENKDNIDTNNEEIKNNENNNTNGYSDFDNYRYPKYSSNPTPPRFTNKRGKSGYRRGSVTRGNSRGRKKTRNNFNQGVAHTFNNNIDNNTWTTTQTTVPISNFSTNLMYMPDLSTNPYPIINTTPSFTLPFVNPSYTNPLLQIATSPRSNFTHTFQPIPINPTFDNKLNPIPLISTQLAGPTEFNANLLPVNLIDPNIAPPICDDEPNIPSGPYFCVKVTCVASGQKHDERSVGQVSVVNWSLTTLANIFVKPEEKIISYLEPLTSLNEKAINEYGMPLLDAVKIVKEYLPTNAMVIGQNVETDLNLLGLKQGKDYRGFIDLRDLWRVWNGQYSQYTHYSLAHQAKCLLGINKLPNNAAADASVSMQLFQVYLYSRHFNKSLIGTYREHLKSHPIEKSFAYKHPYFEGVCQGNRKFCKCGAKHAGTPYVTSPSKLSTFLTPSEPVENNPSSSTHDYEQLQQNQNNEKKQKIQIYKRQKNQVEKEENNESHQENQEEGQLKNQQGEN